MTFISIGVVVREHPSYVQETLASLAANTRQAFDLTLLSDGLDPEALAEFKSLPQSSTEIACGNAACFNRLIEQMPADFYLLLEAGAKVAPAWLDYLLAAFERYPKCGLAGPSTNRAINTQCVFPTAGDTPEEIERMAKMCVRRFGNTCRGLEPRHSLSDFCYLVRGDVIQAIGKADEDGGEDPFWEMDYNVRAARAGFQGIWACAAYVHRAAATECTTREGRQRTATNKQVYDCKLGNLSNDRRYPRPTRVEAHPAPAQAIATPAPLAPTPVSSLARNANGPLKMSQLTLGERQISGSTRPLTPRDVYLPQNLCDLKDLKDFQGIHSGGTIMVCGCGVSLKMLAHPQRFITIGVNDVGRLFHPDYLVVVNPRNQFQDDRFRYVEESQARIVFTQLDLGIRHPHVVRFNLGKRAGTEFSGNALNYTSNSPYIAFCLAVHMGARRVGIIGVDFTNDHFFAQTGIHALARQLPHIDREYQQLYAECERRGVEVFNLSPQSRLTAFPKLSLAEFEKWAIPAFEESATSKKGLRIVSYSTMPVAGVPALLARCITARTSHECRTVWARNTYGNGVTFQGDVEWEQAPAPAADLLKSADVLVVHNGKIDPGHRPLLAGKPVITMAHNYMWNVGTSFVQQGFPGVVVGQYQATLPEFKQWMPVPNPVPLWEEAFQPGPKNSQLTVCYTPSGKHENYPVGHQLYWHSKGYETTTRILERLAQRFNIRLEVVRACQVSHAESLAMKRGAHIVIDECVTGSYHRNSLEGLALGCVVVNGMGHLPQITEVFRTCAGSDAEIPFVRAGLEDLERVLTSLIEQGREALTVAGIRNRTWMEQHWNFEGQWKRFWEPAIVQALEQSSSTDNRNSMPRAAQSHAVNFDDENNMNAKNGSRQPKQGLSVVVCHGGEERLPLLAATLANLRRCSGVNEIIVVDMGTAPFAEALARRWADKYIFVRNDDVFERARSLNIGTALTEYELVLWMDNDLILPADLIATAVAEMRARQLDYLLPYAAVHYLSETDSQRVMEGVVSPADCKPARSYRALHVCGGVGLVRRSFVLANGGLSEMFRGWGGEDGAWWHKATLLGRAEVVQQRDQYIYHLFHPNSGANGGSQHRDRNPYYADNLNALKRMVAVRDRNSYLRLFPAAPLFSSSWNEKWILLVSEHETEIWRPREIGRALADFTGIHVEYQTADSAWEWKNRVHPDAVVVLGSPAGTAFSPNQFPQELWKKTVVVYNGRELNEAVVQRLAQPAGVLCIQGLDSEALRNAGLLPWPIPPLNDSPDFSYSAALRILQPLSLILGRAMPQPETETAVRSDAQEILTGIQNGQAMGTLNDVTILITSFLRPGYLCDCLAGIRKTLPECKVIVIDDSGGQHPDDARFRLIRLPFDSGLSAKRNAGVNACTTGYLLMGSDDFDFSTAEVRAGIEKLVRVLDEHPGIDVAGGHHNDQRYEGFMELVPGSHIKETRLFPSNQQATIQSLSKEYEVYKVDLIVNYFLARNESIRQFPWDERMKIGGEHGDWFLTLKDAGKTVVWVPGVNINELPRDKTKEHPDYGKYRSRAVSLGHKIFLEKRGIKHYFGFDDPVPATLKAASKILIGIISCKRNAERVRAQQETWIPGAIAAGYHVQIFDGERLGVPDDYYSLIQKTQALCRWALAQGYERLLKADDDCCIRVSQLRANSYDYAGIVVAANDLGSVVPPCLPATPKGTYPYNYASGGAYWLSRKAMTIVADAQPNGDWAEDRFVGNTLARHGILVQSIPDYTWVSSGHMPSQWTVLTQLPTPELMRKSFC